MKQDARGHHGIGFKNKVKNGTCVLHNMENIIYKHMTEYRYIWGKWPMSL